jgi:lysozyme
MSGIRTFGIDISSYSGSIDWPRVIQRPVHFVLIRASFISMRGGRLSEQIDANFAKYWAALKNSPVKRGAYQFCRPEYDADKTIALFAKSYKPAKGDLIPTLDIEDQYADVTSVSKAAKLAQIRRMVDLLSREVGRQPMIYTKRRVWDALGNPVDLAQCPLWVIDYKSDYDPILPKPWPTFAFWQSGQNKSMQGIEGDYDPDFFNGTPADMKQFCLQ